MPQSEDGSPLPSPDTCLVVGVGASAGGLEAFGRLLKAMPVRADIALVYVQHLDPNHESMLPHLLSRDTEMPVEAVRDETPLEGGHIYVIPPNASLSIEGRVLRLEARAASHDGTKSIDAFLTSLAADQGESGVGVILSGTGNDGTGGLRAIKEAGGTTLVQVPETAAYDGMPRSAIDAALADHVLSPEDMPRLLVELASRLSGEAGGAPAIVVSDATVHAICDILRVRTRHDFSGYKRTTVARRISRRMEALTLARPEAYLERLEQDSSEAGNLFKEMLIGVTRFFRDPAVFAALAPHVAPRLKAAAVVSAPVRVWVVGCATGEEAYSLAMLLSEQLPADQPSPKIQIFATDLDEQSLQVARRGLYPESISQEVSAERLERFFVHRDHRYQVQPDLRQLCIFSKHNLLHDPPFPELDLVSCRNLLIYLNSTVQARAIRLFHHALRGEGLLILGAAETAGGPNLFEELSRPERIYRRNDAVAQEPLEFPLSGPTRRIAREPHTALATGEGAAFTRSLERAILDEYVPAGMVVRDGGQVLYLFGPTARYLGPSAGAPTASAFGLVHRDLRIELRRALEHAVETHRPASAECRVEVEPGHRERVSIFVRPFTEVVPDAYLVVLRGIGDAPVDREAIPAESAGMDQLRDELRNTRQQLLATIDQLESANQELQSTNEELLSLNEELQSANEELQSSKEEVQTINAELESVNRELSSKVDELGVATSDLENLFEGAQLATVFLDSELLIKRFTPAATEVFRLRPGDVGRPVTDITARFTNGDVAAEIHEVLRTLQRHEVTVTRAEDGNRYLMRILPYRTRQNVIDGVIVTFFDVTELNRAQEELQRLNADLERSASSLLAAGRRKDDFLAMLSHELRNPLAAIASNIDLWQARGVTDPVLVRGIEVAHRQVVHMTRLLNDLLDTARILRGVIELKRQPFDMRGLLTQVVEAYRARTTPVGQALVLSMPDVPTSIPVDGDRDRLEQVLENLLSNAHKFTPEGGHIRVDADVVGDEVVVRVSDDGIGLSPEFVPHVFEPFVQGTRAGERSRGGLGLGLSLVRHLVDLHGGFVGVTSRGPGLGSDFTVRLPLAPSPCADEAPATDGPPTARVGDDLPRRVVVVDDNVDGADMLTAVLQADGHETRAAHDGASALRLVATYRPDVVLLDIGLPDMDGYEVARLMREKHGLRQTRLVALTGYAQEEDKRLARAAGFDHHLVKPVDMTVLRDLLRTAARQKPRT